MDEKTKYEQAAFFCSIVLAIFALLFVFLHPEVLTREYILGDKGILEIAIATLTLGGVVFTGYQVLISAQHNRDTLEHTRTTSRTERFQKATEALGSPQKPVRIAAMLTIQTLAEQDSEVFGRSALGCLSIYINEASETPFEQYLALLASGSENPQIEARTTTIVAALSSAASIREAIRRVPGLASAEISTNRMYLAYDRVQYLNLRDAYFSNCISYASVFAHNWLQSSTMHFRSMRKTTFEHSTFWNARLSAWAIEPDTVVFTRCDLAGARLDFPMHHVELADCRVNGTTVFGKTLKIRDCWTEEHPPQFLTSDPVHNVSIAKCNFKMPPVITAAGSPPLASIPTESRITAEVRHFD